MEGEEPREAGVGEGQALHEEALLVPVEAAHLVGHLVLAQHVPVRLAGVLGAWQRAEGPREGPREQEASRNLPNTMEATQPPPLLTSHSQRRERLTPECGQVWVGQGGRSSLRRRSDLSEGNLVASSKAMFTPNSKSLSR